MAHLDLNDQVRLLIEGLEPQLESPEGLQQVIRRWAEVFPPDPVFDLQCSLAWLNWKPSSAWSRRNCVEVSMHLCNRALAATEDDAMLLATVLSHRAEVYFCRVVGDRSANIEETIECYCSALRLITRESMPNEWARLQTNLGSAWSERVVGDRTDNIERALACFSSALEVTKRETSPRDWALTQMNLGSSWGDRIADERRENVEEAIRCYQAALEVLTREATPVEWAAVQMNLGSAWSERIVGERGENIEQAIRYYSDALEVRTREAMPLEWAATHSNLGSAWSARVRGDSRENIETAISCYEKALQVRTREALPVEWAMTQMNSASAWIGRTAGDRRMNIEEAISRCAAALHVLTRETMPIEWARTQTTWGSALTERIQGDRNDNIDNAVACFRAALEVLTRETTPMDWARAKANLGTAWSSHVADDLTTNFEEAIDCYCAALGVMTRKSMPLEWAMAQMNLGNAYSFRYRGSHSENVQRAIKCYLSALEVYTKEDTPKMWAMTHLGLGHAWRQRVDIANSLISGTTQITDDRSLGNKDASLENAFQSYKEALSIPQLLDNSQAYLALVYKGKCESELGNRAQALECVRSAHGILANATDVELAGQRYVSFNGIQSELFRFHVGLLVSDGPRRWEEALEVADDHHMLLLKRSTSDSKYSSAPRTPRDHWNAGPVTKATSYAANLATYTSFARALRDDVAVLEFMYCSDPRSTTTVTLLGFVLHRCFDIQLFRFNNYPTMTSWLFTGPKRASEGGHRRGPWLAMGEEALDLVINSVKPARREAHVEYCAERMVSSFPKDFEEMTIPDNFISEDEESSISGSNVDLTMHEWQEHKYMEEFSGVVRSILERLPPAVSHLIIIPDRALQRVPFCALKANVEVGISLIDKYQIFTDQSLTRCITKATRGRFDGAQNGPDAILCFRNNEFREIVNVHANARRHFGRAARLYCDRCFVTPFPESIDLLDNCVVMQICGRGIYPATETLFNGVGQAARQTGLNMGSLEGSADLFLSIEDICDLPLQDCKLATVVICNGDAVYDRWCTDTSIGIPQAFLEAGARNVVGPRWPVHPVAAALVIDRFNELLVDCYGPPTASDCLRNAQLEFRQMSVHDVRERCRQRFRNCEPVLDDDFDPRDFTHWAAFSFGGPPETEAESVTKYVRSGSNSGRGRGCSLCAMEDSRVPIVTNYSVR